MIRLAAAVCLLLVGSGPALADCGFLTRPMTESTDGVTRLNVWPEGTLLCFNGRKIVCSTGGEWLERGTGICDEQEIAERDAAVLEGTASRPLPSTGQAGSEPPFGAPGPMPSGAEMCYQVLSNPERHFCDAFFKNDMAGCEAEMRASCGL